MKAGSRAQLAYDKAHVERRLCRDWLVYLMHSSAEKTRSKVDLRKEAMERFKISQNSFDFGWIWAIEDTGNLNWYEPLPRRSKKGKPKRQSDT